MSLLSVLLRLSVKSRNAQVPVVHSPRPTVMVPSKSNSILQIRPQSSMDLRGGMTVGNFFGRFRSRVDQCDIRTRGPYPGPGT